MTNTTPRISADRTTAMLEVFAALYTLNSVEAFASGDADQPYGRVEAALRQMVTDSYGTKLGEAIMDGVFDRDPRTQDQWADLVKHAADSLYMWRDA